MASMIDGVPGWRVQFMASIASRDMRAKSRAVQETDPGPMPDQVRVSATLCLAHIIEETRHLRMGATRLHVSHRSMLPAR